MSGGGNRKAIIVSNGISKYNLCISTIVQIAPQVWKDRRIVC
jgi:hypothetical protein